MKHIEMIVLSLLLVTRGGIAMAQTDSTNVKNDSITWNQELEGIVVKAQKQLVKQEIDGFGLRWQVFVERRVGTESYRQTVFFKE